MGEGSKIAWTDHTFNPWMGCVAVSEACKFCYAEAFVTKRMGLPLWGPKAERRVTSAGNWKEPLRWNRKAKEAGARHRVFCASLADVFEDRPDLVEPRARLLRLIEATPHLDWLLLTKRPERMVDLALDVGWVGRWPANVWAGTTVESQARAHERIPHLLMVPARVRFLSVEPLLGPLDLAYACFNGADSLGTMPGIDWVIVGGESGHGARPFDIAWARSLRNQCKAAGVAYFFKQAGSRPLDGSKPLRLKSYKGDDLAELPADLHAQELPA
jgi:protein gp37